jgi:hypothetical protein
MSDASLFAATDRLILQTIEIIRLVAKVKSLRSAEAFMLELLSY